MTSWRRNQNSVLLLTAAILALFLAAGCEPEPTTIVGTVSYLNPASSYQVFPPVPAYGTHSGVVDDDVAYARLVDDSGNGATIWESVVFDAGTVLLPYVGVPTSDDGVYIGSFVINPTDAEISAATMPLRLEVFLYDAPVAGAFPALDPALDADRYSYFNANGEGNPQWYSLIDIQTHEVKHSSLYATLPIAP